MTLPVFYQLRVPCVQICGGGAYVYNTFLQRAGDRFILVQIIIYCPVGTHSRDARMRLSSSEN